MATIPGITTDCYRIPSLPAKVIDPFAVADENYTLNPSREQQTESLFIPDADNLDAGAFFATDKKPVSKRIDNNAQKREARKTEERTAETALRSFSLERGAAATTRGITNSLIPHASFESFLPDNLRASAHHNLFTAEGNPLSDQNHQVELKNHHQNLNPRSNRRGNGHHRGHQVATFSQRSTTQETAHPVRAARINGRIITYQADTSLTRAHSASSATQLTFGDSLTHYFQPNGHQRTKGGSNALFTRPLLARALSLYLLHPVLTNNGPNHQLQRFQNNAPIKHLHHPFQDKGIPLPTYIGSNPLMDSHRDIEVFLGKIFHGQGADVARFLTWEKRNNPYEGQQHHDSDSDTENQNCNSDESDIGDHLVESAQLYITV